MEQEIRKLLVISTAHIPDRLRVLASEHEDTSEWNAVVHVLDTGFLLWVPDVPQDTCEETEEGETTHEAILAIQLYARELDCDYVLIDRDGPIENGLPTFEEDAEPQAYEPDQQAQIAAAVARDADDASLEELEAASAILDRIGPSTKR